ncbi:MULTISPECIES: WD40 repeat domain-containing serine/threonine protein kinase [unclassified Streptomyces]|uniref:WD40 repeat domain-containing serine/threonine protein kinase n=1 Tax=unclassified Streptomyces TaxID=2593676 RepID=UPI00278C7652|nr:MULTISPECIES: serine/threonine-protein kinase [unclassified Streptomyces]
MGQVLPQPTGEQPAGEQPTGNQPTGARPRGEPERLGHWWLARRLGSGGQGVVYEGYDTAGRRAAVKVLRASFGTDREQRARFAKEAGAARRVARFCTAEVLDADIDGERPYIASEYIEGPTLTSHIRANGPLHGTRLYRLALGVATALAAIHEAGVVHRDLKPDNILLGRDGGPYVVDFGVARLVGQTTGSARQAVGTPLYMAPEQLSARGGEPLPGAAVDVFAWGSVVLFAATGQHTFAAPGVGEVLRRIRSFEPDTSVLEQPLRRLVDAALAKRPALRPSARDLLLALIRGDGTVSLVPEFEGDRDAQRHGASAAVPVVSPRAADPPLGDLAEQVYARLPRAGAGFAVRGVLLQLVVAGEAPDGSEDAIRSATWPQLFAAAATDDQRLAVEEVVAAFARAGLLHSHGGYVRLPSGALPHAWPRLRDWITVDRAALRGRQELRDSARRWEAGGRRRELLPGEGQFTQLRALAAALPRQLRPSAMEDAFLYAAGRARRRSRVLRRALLAAGAALLALALVAGTLLLEERSENRTKNQELAARRAATVTATLRLTDPAAAMQFAVAAHRTAPAAVETRAALLGALTQPERAATPLGSEAVDERLLSADGRTAVTVRSARATRWEVRTGERDKAFGVPAGATATALSPDGRHLAVAVDARTTLVDTRTGKKSRGPSAGGRITALRFSANSRLLAATGEAAPALWDVSDARPRPTPSEAAGLRRGGAELSPDGRLLAVCQAGEDVVFALYDTASGRRVFGNAPGGPLTAHDDCAVGFAADGGTVAAVLDDEVCSWTVAGHRQKDILDPVPVSGPARFAFSPDSTVLAVSDENALSVYRPADLGPGDAPPAVPVRHPTASQVVTALAADDTGHQIRYLDDGASPTAYTLDLWTVRQPPLPAARAPATALAPGGGALAVQRPDGKVTAVAPAAERATETYGAGTYPVGTAPPAEVRHPYRRLVFGPDGRGFLVQRTDAPEVELWRIEDGRARRADRFSFGSRITSLALFADGRTIAVGRASGVDLYATDTHKRQGRLPAPAGSTLAVDPEGTRLATSTGYLILLDDPHHPFLLRATRATALAFNDDGTLLASGDGTGRVSLWRTGPRQPLGSLAGTDTGDGVGGPEAVASLAFAPGGLAKDALASKTLAVGGAHGTLHLFDVNWQRRLGHGLFPRGTGPVSVAYTRDGARLLAGTPDAPLRGYPLRNKVARSTACTRVAESGRGPVTEEEWAARMAPVPYEKPC